MIKKNDLVKQFELVVKQEIINHNLQIEASNQRMNELSMFLIDHKSFTEKSIANINSSIVSLSIELEKAKKAIPKDFDELKKTLEKLSSETNSCLTSISYLIRSIDDINKEIEKTNSKMDERKYFIYHLSERIKGLELREGGSSSHIERRIAHHIEDLKTELSIKPKEIKNIECCIENHKSEYVNEIAGLKCEIDLIKKSNFKKDKHIENLYTQIKRLKG